MTNMWSLTLVLLYTIITLSESNWLPHDRMLYNKLNTMLRDSKIIPDVINECPHSILQVNFHSLQLKVGNIVLTNATKARPMLNWVLPAEKTFHTICLVDPDYPDRREPNQKEMLHWLVVNTPGNNLLMGESLFEYMTPEPPAYSGYHRYVILVYQQSNKLEFDEPILTNCSSSIEHRVKFSVSTFAKKYNLGVPIAGNYFLSQNEKKLLHPREFLKSKVENK